MANKFITKVQHIIVSLLVVIISFGGMMTMVPPNDVRADGYDFIDGATLSALGFSSGDDFKSALVDYINGTNTRGGSNLEGRNYANGCIQFVMEMYYDTLLSRGGVQASASAEAQARATALLQAFVNDSGTMWARVSGFAGDPQMLALIGQSSITPTPINGDLAARLGELGAQGGDIIILGGGHSTDSSYDVYATWTSSGGTFNNRLIGMGYATREEATTFYNNWKARNSRDPRFTVTSHTIRHVTEDVDNPTYAHIAILSGEGTNAWQASFSYSTNSGTSASLRALGNQGVGTKGYANVYILRVFGSAAPKPTYHTTGGKVIMVSEWNDLCAAYGEQYVRENISFTVTVNQTVEIITDLGPDGVANSTEPRDDTYYTVGAGETIWSGNLVGITPTTIDIGGVQYYQFTLPDMPTDGQFALPPDSADTEITITITETGAFNALLPG